MSDDPKTVLFKTGREVAAQITESCDHADLHRAQIELFKLIGQLGINRATGVWAVAAMLADILLSPDESGKLPCRLQVTVKTIAFGFILEEAIKQTRAAEAGPHLHVVGEPANTDAPTGPLAS